MSISFTLPQGLLPMLQFLAMAAAAAAAASVLLGNTNLATVCLAGLLT